jgi:hypothetical protein
MFLNKAIHKSKTLLDFHLNLLNVRFKELIEKGKVMGLHISNNPILTVILSNTRKDQITVKIGLIDICSPIRAILFFHVIDLNDCY